MPQDIKDWVISNAGKSRDSRPESESAGAAVVSDQITGVDSDDEMYDNGFAYIKNVHGRKVKIPLGSAMHHNAW